MSRTRVHILLRRRDDHRRACMARGTHRRMTTSGEQAWAQVGSTAAGWAEEGPGIHAELELISGMGRDRLAEACPVRDEWLYTKA